MDVFNYASVMDGKVMFGAPSDCPRNVDIILDTRSEYDLPYDPIDVNNHTRNKLGSESTHPELILYPIWPGYEPVHAIRFENFMMEIDFRISKGETLYIIDPDGTERSVLIAWFFLHKNKTCNTNVSLEEINRAYQLRSNKPLKWSRVQVPRFTRQLVFGQWFYSGKSKDAFDFKFRYRERGNANKNRALKIKGTVRVGCLTHPDISVNYGDPMLEGYIPVRLQQCVGQNWFHLSGSNLGPFNLHFVTMFGETIVERSHSLCNAFFSLMVFDKHLKMTDQEETPSRVNLISDFFSDHQLIAGATKSLKKHPLYVRKMPHCTGCLPKYLYWQGELIPFREAKIYIYSTMYYYLVKRTSAYRDLVTSINGGMDSFILDFDAIDFHELGMTYETYMDQDDMPWTDAHILYGMLTNNMPWLMPDLVSNFFELAENGK
uniref:Uncharacterized protein n=1 Tax=viral metagenome TaxID=1070528 RepID=A0A6C0CII2_9ZZZZ